MIENFIKSLAVQAGDITLDFFKKAEVQYTKDHSLDVVTQADIASNKFIVEEIKAKFPEDGIISEEQGEYNIKAEYLWIVDPLDGTLNFSKGIPTYCILIARAKNEKIESAVIYDPINKDTYFSERGKGAFLNDKKIECSQIANIEGSTGCINGTTNARILEILNKMISSVPEKKIYISVPVCLGMAGAYIASGKRDWGMFISGSVWDHAAPSLILEESGCVVTNMEGKPWTLKDKTMMAANKELHAELIKHI
jgi:myo-inositol-1(or 4)-monophosphatase